MSLEPPPQQRLTDRKRAAILEAAVQEFQESGFDDTSMNRVSERAGVSKRTVYNHFKSKDALFEAIIQELIDRTDALPDFPFEPDRGLAEQLSGYSERVIDLLTSGSFQGLARVSLSRFLRSPGLARETIGDQRRFLSKLVAWIGQASASGCLSAPDAGFAAEQFCGLLEAMAFWPQIFGLASNPGPDQKRAIIESAVAMFLDHYEA